MNNHIILAYVLLCATTNPMQYIKKHTLKHEGPVFSVYAHEKAIIIGGKNIQPTLYSLEQGKKLGTIIVPEEEPCITCIEVQPDIINLCNYNKKTQCTNFYQFPNILNQSKILSKMIATKTESNNSSSERGTLHNYPNGVWITHTGAFAIDPMHHAQIICQENRGNYLIINSLESDTEDNEVFILEQDFDSQEVTTNLLGTHDSTITSLAINCDETQCASASKDGAVKLWSTLKKTILLETQLEKTHATTLCFVHYGDHLAFGCDDGSILFWNTVTGHLKKVQAHEKSVSDITFSPNDLYMISASSDTNVVIWNMASLHDTMYTKLKQQTLCDIILRCSDQ